jgi:hypothetical protein
VYIIPPFRRDRHPAGASAVIWPRDGAASTHCFPAKKSERARMPTSSPFLGLFAPSTARWFVPMERARLQLPT